MSIRAERPPFTLGIADETSRLPKILVPRLARHRIECRVLPPDQVTDPAALDGLDLLVVSRRLRLIQERTLGQDLVVVDRAARIVVALDSAEFLSAASEFRAPVYWFFVDRQLAIADSVMFLAAEGYSAVPSDLHSLLFSRCEDWITDRMIDGILAGLPVSRIGDHFGLSDAQKSMLRALYSTVPQH